MISPHCGASSISMHAESMALMERTIREVCGLPDLGLLDETRIIVHADAQGVETLVLDGKPVMRFWPAEVVDEVTPGCSRVVVSRRWVKL